MEDDVTRHIAEAKEFDLYKYLKTQFTDLTSAKQFMHRWATEMDQEIQGFGLISSRSLAAHVSAILEGKTEDDSSESTFFTSYLNTKYGSELYFAAWGGEDL